MGLKRFVKKVVSAPIKAVQTVTKALPTPVKTLIAPVAMTHLAVAQAKSKPAQFRAVMKTNALMAAGGVAAAAAGGATLSAGAKGLIAKGTALKASVSKYQSYAAKLKGLQGLSTSSIARSQDELTGQMPDSLAKGLQMTRQSFPSQKKRVIYVSRATYAKLRRSGY